MQIEHANDVQIVRLDDELMDRDSVDSTFRALVQVMNESDSGKLLLEFEDVNFLASPALGILISLHQHSEQNKRHLRLCNLKSAIYDVFSVTQVTRIFNIDNSEAEALANF